MFAINILLIVVALSVYILKTVIKPKKFPPGPRWYPFLGSCAIVDKLTKKYGSQWKAFSFLAKQYSTQVLGLKLGEETVVVVFGENNIRKVFLDRAFEGRPYTFFIKLRCLGKRMGITFTDGPLWKEHRNFTVKHLKNVGFGKTTMEKEIQNEINVISEYIEKNRHNPISPKNIFAMSVINILWKFTAGNTIKKDRLEYLLNLLNQRSRFFTMTGTWLNKWPLLRFIAPEFSGYNLINEMNQQLSEIIQEAILKHKNGDVQQNDFIYSFLQKINSGEETYTEEHLKVICLDIIIAGSQTTSNTMEFAMLMVLRNQDLQNKIYDEIHSVLGDKVPSWEDAERMTYTMAFLYEVQRYYTIVPLAGPRRTLKDSEIDGYIIPKDTNVLMGIGDTHFDPTIWTDPEEFKPERFINDEGSLYNTERILSFGLGKYYSNSIHVWNGLGHRRCPGDALAKSFIFIVFVGILKKFKIKCSNGVLPSIESNIGLISSAKPYTADFTPRK